MVYLIHLPKENAIGVQELAEIQKLSPTYLSKILTKLTKAGLIESTPGVKGGYKISRFQKDISFFDVIKAIEGDANLFDCSIHHEGCLIEDTMRQAEENMKKELQAKLLIDIVKEAEARRSAETNQ
jgi:Rrf2 family protein